MSSQSNITDSCKNFTIVSDFILYNVGQYCIFRFQRICVNTFSWDYKCYPVSVFSYRLLDQMYTYPLFYVPDLNPALYINNKGLLSARKKRVHLKFVKDFVKTCRFAVRCVESFPRILKLNQTNVIFIYREQVYFESIPEHIANDPDIWSLSDFIDVRNKSMQHSIDELIEKCEHHIFNCVVRCNNKYRFIYNTF